jgi:hypothetical protein
MLSWLPKPSHSLRLCAIGLAIAIGGLGAAAQPPPPVTGGPPIPTGEARVWFYRVFFPEDTGGMPPVSMNGQLVGYARAGWSFYRDMPAGAYHVTVESYLPNAVPGLRVDAARTRAICWRRPSPTRTRC